MSDSLGRFTKVMEAAVAALEERREEINDLNVFPVADGDTGDNMLLTVRAVTEELARLDDEVSAGDLDDVGRTEIVEAVARAALLGARGNSGVILSQLIRGAAEELISRHGKPVDPQLLASAMLKAAGQARGSVRDPQEGTILTVIDDMASGLGSAIADGGAGPLPDNVDATTQDTALADALAVAVVAGEASVARGPELLDVLRESGVVDAG
ncbi:MAG: DAK2 domain-containing protein, partial [Actinomycetes bacterium]